MKSGPPPKPPRPAPAASAEKRPPGVPEIPPLTQPPPRPSARPPALPNKAPAVPLDFSQSMHGHRPDQTLDVEPLPDDTTSRLAPRIGNRVLPTPGVATPARPMGPRPKGTLLVPVRRVGTVRVPLPEYQTDLAAGMDLVAAIEGPLTIAPFARVLVPTGIAMALPPGYEGQVRPRSGLAWSRGLTILNAPGTIDADYRGEIKVLLVNFSSDNAEVLPGERIAQLVVARHERIDLQVVESLDDTSRGSGGYGSTGV